MPPWLIIRTGSQVRNYIDERNRKPDLDRVECEFSSSSRTLVKYKNWKI
jgi:ribosomal protein L33